MNMLWQVFHKRIEDSMEEYVKGNREQAIEILRDHKNRFPVVYEDLRDLGECLQEYAALIDQLKDSMEKVEDIEAKRFDNKIMVLYRRIKDMLLRLTRDVKKEE